MLSCTTADLEYPTEFNNNIDGNRLVDTLLELCAASLKVALTNFSSPYF